MLDTDYASHRNYVAPAPDCNEQAAGYRAFVDGVALNPAWSDAKKRGWNRALWVASYAETNAYLVQCGVTQ